MTPVRKTLAFFRMNRITKISAYNINEATKESGVYRSVWPRIHWIYLNRLAKYFWIMIYNIQRRYYTTDKGEGYLVSAEKMFTQKRHRGFGLLSSFLRVSKKAV